MDKAHQQVDRDFGRKKDLAQIHIAKKILCLDDEIYRSLLHDFFGVSSSAALDDRQRKQLLDYFRKQGWGTETKPRGANKKLRPRWFKTIEDPLKGRMTKKIWAMLADAGRGDAYIDGLVRHMFKLDRLEFCNEDQLMKIISALQIDARRRSNRA